MKPLLLVSQVQRSGGSLMAQLFDGHPQLYAHPFEIHIGYPRKWNWPILQEAEGPLGWFQKLFEAKLNQFIESGYCKPGSNPLASSEKFPFQMSTEELERIFIQKCANIEAFSRRLIIDCYFESFFEAWKNYTSTGRERYVSGFTPGALTDPSNAQAIFTDYPDGRFISIIRSPAAWAASYVKHTGRSVEQALPIWIASTKAAHRHAENNDLNFKAIIFEQLISEPERVMREVSEFCGISFSDGLLIPSFLGRPVYPNSSFVVSEKGINKEMLKVRNKFSQTDNEMILNVAMPLYQDSEVFIL